MIHPMDAWVQPMARMLRVRIGEGRSVVLVVLLFVLAEAARSLGEIGIDTLVSLRLGPQHYPSLFVVLGAVSLVISLAYGAALGRLPRRPLLIGMPLGYRRGAPGGVDCRCGLLATASCLPCGWPSSPPAR